MNDLTISGLARAAGVGVETIRFYQRKGLLAQPPRPRGGIRRYGPSDAARVRFVKTAQRTGFTLAETRQLLRLDDGAGCDEARAIAAQKLSDVRARITDLQGIETALADLIRRCGGRRRRVSCPLIDSIYGQSSR